MSDVILDFWPSDPGVKVFVIADGDEHEVARAAPARDAKLEAQLTQLLSGEPPAGVADEVAAKLSQWLLTGDVRKHLNLALDGPPFRLVLRLRDGVATRGLADLPFELLEEPAADYFVFKPNVRSLVYHLDKVSGAPNPSTGRSWPLRVTIVRSNPQELGGAVPIGAPIRDHVLALGQAIGGGAVEVVLVSSEDGGPAVTWERVATHLRGKAPPDVLVYLGHADLPESVEQARGGRIQLEAADDDAAVPLSFLELRTALDRVPVVVLAGCLTGAELAKRPELHDLVPNWMRANQGLAQALVNSSSGVQIAVGMRCRLETEDAERFLNEFFTSLLQREPGDVEAAVTWARKRLLDLGAHPPRWASPVLFRRLAEEPTFPFLRTPLSPVIAGEETIQATRQLAWEALKGFPLSGGQGGLQAVRDHLERSEATFIERARQAAIAVFKPSRVHDAFGREAQVTVSVHLPVAASELRGRVVVSDPALPLSKAAPAAAILAAGFEATVVVQGPGVIGFDIRPVTQIGVQAQPRQLPEGPLFTFAVRLGDAPALHTMKVEIVQLLPAAPHVGWLDAVLVVPP